MYCCLFEKTENKCKRGQGIFITPFTMEFFSRRRYWLTGLRRKICPTALIGSKAIKIGTNSSRMFIRFATAPPVLVATVLPTVPQPLPCVILFVYCEVSTCAAHYELHKNKSISTASFTKQCQCHSYHLADQCTKNNFRCNQSHYWPHQKLLCYKISRGIQ